ncbi:MAG: ribonuclease HII, partial [Bdellovibrio sp.]
LYTDSKVLSPHKREILAQEIQEEHFSSIAWATVQEIEELNILQAALLAMSRALHQLLEAYSWKKEEVHVLVDGNQPIPNWPVTQQTTVVKGDLRAAPISAASIVAKVARDQKMCELEDRYPGYGFQKHKGYCTKEHQAAIARLGPCPEHRKSFKGVREFLG